MGSFAVQFACATGAHVIATASGDGVDIARSLGAHQVIDNRRQDATRFVFQNLEADRLAKIVDGGAGGVRMLTDSVIPLTHGLCRLRATHDGARAAGSCPASDRSGRREFLAGGWSAGRPRNGVGPAIVPARQARSAHAGTIATLLCPLAAKDADWAWSLHWITDHATGAPLAIDQWESMGPGSGVFAKRSGVVDPNSLTLDRVRCAEALVA